MEYWWLVPKSHIWLFDIWDLVITFKTNTLHFSTTITVNITHWLKMLAFLDSRSLLKVQFSFWILVMHLNNLMVNFFNIIPFIIIHGFLYVFWLFFFKIHRKKSFYQKQRMWPLTFFHQPTLKLLRMWTTIYSYQSEVYLQYYMKCLLLIWLH